MVGSNGFGILALGATFLEAHAGGPGEQGEDIRRIVVVVGAQHDTGLGIPVANVGKRTDVDGDIDIARGEIGEVMPESAH